MLLRVCGRNQGRVGACRVACLVCSWHALICVIVASGLLKHSPLVVLGKCILAGCSSCFAVFYWQVRDMHWASDVVEAWQVLSHYAVFHTFGKPP